MNRFALLSLAFLLLTMVPPSAAQTDRVEAVRQAVWALAEARVAGGELARANGYIYTIDVGQLMLAAAQDGNAEVYAALYDLVTQSLILNDPSDPYTQGFVGWRVQPGQPLDASGTTEALRVAKALWIGADQFGRPADRELALLVLGGYARHEAVDQGIWLIRNYFNLGTRAFATNTYLVDYDPDFVALAAATSDDAILQAVAQQSYALLNASVSPSGLLYDIVQPEIRTLVPDLDIVAFSPNDIIQVLNSCTVAETVVQGNPAVAAQTLDFALQRLPDLRKYYLGRSGEPTSDQHAGNPEWTCLLRLAARLGRADAVDMLLEPAVSEWERLLQNPDQLSLYEMGEILLAIHAKNS
jgi:hypothetical protein